MSNLRPFQIAALAGFGILAVIAVILLSTFQPGQDEALSKYGDRVLIWGTVPEDAFDRIIMDLSDNDPGFTVVDYQRIDARTFNETFVNAIAEGRSPDLVLLPNSELVRQRSKLQAISYDTIPERNFRDAYIDGADIFRFADGIYAIPFAVDPLILYWNRDLFASAGFAQPPTTWEYVVSTIVPSLSARDNNRTIQQSAIAFGEFQNIRNAKETILMLALQSGSNMIYERDQRYVIDLNYSSSANTTPPLTAALQFYTNFSNPNAQLYSWNRQQQLDRLAFIAGDLALYFGFGSEVEDIRDQNPNLSFDVTAVPQGAAASVRRTYGEFYGFAIPKATPNPMGAYRVALELARPEVASVVAADIGFAPAQRTAIAPGSANAERQIIFDSALIARGWLDPNSAQTDSVFEDMVEDVTSGRERVATAVSDAITKLRLAF